MAKAKGKPEEVVKVKSTTKIMHCKCNNEFGSAEYTLDSRIFSSFREAVNSAKNGYFKTVELNWSVE